MGAVTMAASAAYDIIFMDMQMPIKDGLTATNEIRRMRVHEQTPIIAITANAFREVTRGVSGCGDERLHL